LTQFTDHVKTIEPSDKDRCFVRINISNLSITELFRYNYYNSKQDCTENSNRVILKRVFGLILTICSYYCVFITNLKPLWVVIFAHIISQEEHVKSFKGSDYVDIKGTACKLGTETSKVLQRIKQF
jgi:hypothetical protein